MNRIKFALSTATLGALWGAAAFAASNANEVIVQFKSQASAVSVRDSLQRNIDVLDTSSSAARDLGALSAAQYIRSNLAVLRFATSLSPLEAARALRKDPRVAWAQPNYIMTIMPIKEQAQEKSVFSSLFATPKDADPGYINAPALPSPAQADPQLSDAWGMAKIKAPQAWKIQAGDRKIVVADIDTGIDYTHEDLVNNLWHNPKPTNGDLIGYDFANKDSFPFDDHMHGTHTAGTIGATGGNGIGVSGVSPAVSIMALKFITSAGSGTTADAVLAIDYAIAHGARVMSNSWGGPADDAEDNKVLEDAVGRANTADILFVAAAGNDGADNDTTPVYPAAIKLPNVLTVAASNISDKRSFFSNFGKTTVHVAAPGSNVLSTVPGNKYAQESGTSMACPHVAGLAALILSAHPELKAAQVKEIIMSTVDQLADFQGKIVTGGRVNAEAALQRAASIGI